MLYISHAKDDFVAHGVQISSNPFKKDDNSCKLVGDRTKTDTKTVAIIAGDKDSPAPEHQFQGKSKNVVSLPQKSKPYSFKRPKINFITMDLENDIEEDEDINEFTENNKKPSISSRSLPKRACRNEQNLVSEHSDSSEESNPGRYEYPESGQHEDSELDSDMSIEDLKRYYKNI